MCKFESADNPGYRAIKFQLVLWLKEIKEEMRKVADLKLAQKEKEREVEGKRIGPSEVGNGTASKSVSIGRIFSGRDSHLEFS